MQDSSLHHSTPELGQVVRLTLFLASRILDCCWADYVLGNVRLAKPLRECVCVCRSVEGVWGRRRGLLAGSGVGRGAAVSRQPARGESAPRAEFMLTLAFDKSSFSTLAWCYCTGTR